MKKNVGMQFTALHELGGLGPNAVVAFEQRLEGAEGLSHADI